MMLKVHDNSNTLFQLRDLNFQQSERMLDRCQNSMDTLLCKSVINACMSWVKSTFFSGHCHCICMVL